MKLLHLCVAFLVLVVELISGVSTLSSVVPICYTERAAVAANPLPTVWSTFYSTATETKTTFIGVIARKHAKPVSNNDPPHSWVTKTRKVKVPTKSSDEWTETIYKTVTAEHIAGSVTETVTTISTTTITVPTLTHTIHAGKHFKPMNLSLPEPSTHRNAMIIARSQQLKVGYPLPTASASHGTPIVPTSQSVSKRADPSAIEQSNLHPARVSCNYFSMRTLTVVTSVIESLTITGPVPAKTRNVPRVGHVTTWTTIHHKKPVATRTITVTIHSSEPPTPASTYTFTSMTTTKVYAHTATFYAACAPNNIIRNVSSGLSISAVVPPKSKVEPINQFFLDVDLPNDCCIAAIQMEHSYFWYFDPKKQPDRRCAISRLDKCPLAKENFLPAEIEYSRDGQAAVGNGNCGDLNEFRQV